MSANGKTIKRIFISDLHMGDDRSLTEHPPEYPYCYGWFRDDTTAQRISMLADFLDYLIQHPDTCDELIILGDLFDQWVCPAGFEPTTYDRIVNQTTQNQRVIANLRTMAASDCPITLYYVPGNHDMLTPRDFMEENFPGVQFIGENHIGVFQEGELAAEHGSQYTLFCAPNPGMGGQLPIGFYISRAAADKKAISGGDDIDIGEALDAIIHDFFKDITSFYLTGMKELYEAIAQGMGLKLDSTIVMNGLDNVPGAPTVEEVADNYADLWKQWERIRPQGVSALQAMMNEVFHLHGVAERHYFKPDTAKIAIFGHTHKYTMRGYHRHDNRLDDCLTSSCCDYIYANSGTWINSHKYCTYVQTELNPAENKHYVRINRYESQQNPAVPMGEKYIVINK